MRPAKILDCQKVLAQAVRKKLESASVLAKELKCCRTTAWHLLGGANNWLFRVSESRLHLLAQVLDCDPEDLLAELAWALEVRYGRNRLRLTAELDHCHATGWSWRASNMRLTLHEVKSEGPHVASLELTLPDLVSPLQAVLAGGFRQWSGQRQLTLQGYTLDSDATKVRCKQVLVSGTAATRS